MASRKNRLAAGRTVRALRATGRLEACDESAIALVYVTADLVDDIATDPDQSAYSKAQVVRTHLAALNALIPKSTAQGDSGLDAILEAMAVPYGYGSEQPFGP